MSSNTGVLKLPFSEVAGSDRFKKTAIAMGFLCLQDIVDAGVPQLIKTEGFSYEWCYELFGVLEGYGLLGELERGSNE